MATKGHENLSISQMHLLFVQTLKVHSVLLNKSQQPSIKNAKAAALELFIDEYKNKTGVQLNADQIKKKFNNFKSDLKKKNRFEENGQ